MKKKGESMSTPVPNRVESANVLREISIELNDAIRRLSASRRTKKKNIEAKDIIKKEQGESQTDENKRPRSPAVEVAETPLIAVTTKGKPKPKRSKTTPTSTTSSSKTPSSKSSSKQQLSSMLMSSSKISADFFQVRRTPALTSTSCDIIPPTTDVALEDSSSTLPSENHVVITAPTSDVTVRPKMSAAMKKQIIKDAETRSDSKLTAKMKKQIIKDAEKIALAIGSTPVLSPSAEAPPPVLPPKKNSKKKKQVVQEDINVPPFVPFTNLLPARPAVIRTSSRKPNKPKPVDDLTCKYSVTE